MSISIIILLVLDILALILTYAWGIYCTCKTYFPENFRKEEYVLWKYETLGETDAYIINSTLRENCFISYPKYNYFEAFRQQFIKLKEGKLFTSRRRLGETLYSSPMYQSELTTIVYKTTDLNEFIEYVESFILMKELSK